mgnify:CR=1 FL=1
MLALLSGCHKDTFEEFETETTTTTSEDIIVYNSMEGKIAGIVYDENNTPVDNAIIDINGQLTQTDEDGLFYLTDAELDPQGTYIKANKDGYILGSDMIYPSEGINRSYIQMMKLSRDKNFDVTNGGTIQIERGGSIEFEPNAIRSELGSTYTGTVYVTAKRLATDDPHIGDKMPGGLVAEDNAGRTVVLATLGMVAVELRGENDEELNLKAGSKAKIKFPIAAQDQANAPETIPLWHFDEDRGIWIEEGSATRVGNDYIGQVAHFSFWNCDAPFPLINLCMNVYNEDGTPATDVRATVCAGNLGAANSYSCNGVINGKVPKNQLLTLKLYANSSCGEIIYEQEIGPFGSNVKLDPITLSSSNKYTLSGKVICDGVPVVNSMVFITSNSFTDIVQTDEQGYFVYKTCYDGLIKVYGKDIDTNEGSLTQEINFDEANPFALLTFDVCSDCTFEAEIMVEEGLPCDSTSNVMVVVAGTGNYTYNWNTGSNDPNLGAVTSGSYAVTIVEEGTQCKKVLTIDVVKEQIYLDWTYASTSVDCVTGEGGSITLSVSNGVEPYAYEWYDSTGTLISTDKDISNLSEGIYEINITDANGCEISGRVSLESSGLNLQAGQREYRITCNNNIVIIEPEFPDNNYAYTWQSLNGIVQDTNRIITLQEAGEFLLTVTNAEGCTQQFEYYVTDDTTFPQVEYELDCEGYFQFINIFTFATNDYSLEIISSQGQLIPVQGNVVNYNVFDLGFSSFSIHITDNNNGCQNQQTGEIAGGSNELLEIVSTSPPTCEGCDDGFIDAKFKDNSNCQSCKLEIYTNNGDGYVLVTDMNNNKQLTTGTYYVAINDGSGCVSEFQIVAF